MFHLALGACSLSPRLRDTSKIFLELFEELEVVENVLYQVVQEVLNSWNEDPWLKSEVAKAILWGIGKLATQLMSFDASQESGVRAIAGHASLSLA